MTAKYPIEDLHMKRKNEILPVKSNGHFCKMTASLTPHVQVKSNNLV
jgi:hypothetical protein